MISFEYDKTSADADYYETLSNLMERWEYEIVEFKEAKGQYSEDKIGRYFSAISNEANLKNQQYGWFVLGVSENNNKYPVGTADMLPSKQTSFYYFACLPKREHITCIHGAVFLCLYGHSVNARDRDEAERNRCQAYRQMLQWSIWS